MRTSILFVDDNPQDRELMAIVTGRLQLDLELHTVSGVDEALTFIARPRPNLKLILTDLKMPGRDGFELLRAIRRHPTYGTIPVIVLTSSSTSHDRDRAYSAGCNAYHEKPYSLSDLTRLVGETLHYWLHSVQLPSAFNLITAG